MSPIKALDGFLTVGSYFHQVDDICVYVKLFHQNHRLMLLTTGSDKRGVLEFGSIPVALLSSS